MLDIIFDNATFTFRLQMLGLNDILAAAERRQRSSHGPDVTAYKASAVNTPSPGKHPANTKVDAQQN
jgi:hypothetical protein